MRHKISYSGPLICLPSSSTTRPHLMGQEGQPDAGFVLISFYEDKGEDLLDKFTDTFIATNALKMG